MSEKSSQEPSETDWSRFESVVRSKEGRPQEYEEVTYPLERAESPRTEVTAPTELTVALPNIDEYRGILFEWKKGKIDRNSTLKALQAHYDAQLDALQYHLGKAVSVSNARADVIAEEFLEKLNAEHMEIMKELGLRNLKSRATALIEVQDMIVAKVREVQAKNWPPSSIERTLADLSELGRRGCAQMMKELGA